MRPAFSILVATTIHLDKCVTLEPGPSFRNQPNDSSSANDTLVRETCFSRSSRAAQGDCILTEQYFLPLASSCSRCCRRATARDSTEPCSVLLYSVVQDATAYPHNDTPVGGEEMKENDGPVRHTPRQHYVRGNREVCPYSRPRQIPDVNATGRRR